MSLEPRPDQAQRMSRFRQEELNEHVAHLDTYQPLEGRSSVR